MKLNFLLIYVLIIFAFTTAMPVFAISPSSILVDTIPPNPAPYENTIITLNSFSANLDSVLISWLVNGKNALSGIGKKSFSLNAPAAGLEIAVTAKISLPDGEIEKRIIIRPTVMVLLYQANDSYVPPFYKGRALPTAESEIKVVAMPEIRIGNIMANSKNMTYSWKKDYNNMAEDSGYGKNFFLYTNDYLEDSNNVGVVASTVDQQYSSESNINIGMTIPKISFYKKDNEFGIVWERILADRHRIQGDETIVAIPYFISPKNPLNPRLVWNWFINDNPINLTSFKKNLVPLKVESGTTGTSKLRLQIENKDKIFQTVNKEINIEY